MFEDSEDVDISDEFDYDKDMFEDEDDEIDTTIPNGDDLADDFDDEDLTDDFGDFDDGDNE